MTLFVWPYRLLRPGKLSRPRLTSRAVMGPPALSGATEVGAQDGGGFWTFPVTGVGLMDWATVQAWEAWTAHLDGGLTPFIMPIPSLGLAPRPQIGGEPALPGVPAPSSDIFNQDPGFGRPMMLAALHAGAALGATTLVIDVSRGAPFKGGETLSLDHATVGWRPYQVGRVIARAGMRFTVEVRPPLREAATTFTALELDVPRCVMALDPANAGDMGAGSDVSRFDSVSARFVEWFGDI